MDNLKKYLQENKSEMDVDAPRADLWQAIQQKTNAKKQPVIPIKTVVRLLAAACVLTTIVLALKWRTEKTPVINKNQLAATKPIIKNNADTIIALKKPPLILPQKQQPVYLAVEKKKKTIAPNNLNSFVEKENEAVNHLENGYAKMVNLQLNRIRNTPVFAEGPDYFNSFKTQLQQIDKDEADIRKFIKTNGLTDELLDQLINVSQQKLTLLKTLQTEINKMNNQVKQNQSPSDSTKSYYLHI